jgi:hypothetical protein
MGSGSYATRTRSYAATAKLTGGHATADAAKHDAQWNGELILIDGNMNIFGSIFSLMNGNLTRFDLRKTYLTGIRMALITCCSTTVSLLQVFLLFFILTPFFLMGMYRDQASRRLFKRLAFRKILPWVFFF